MALGRGRCGKEDYKERKKNEDFKTRSEENGNLGKGQIRIKSSLEKKKRSLS